MMRGGSRPKRQTRVPRHLENQELSSPRESGSGSESDSDAGSWASEDDPERLWCICQQPHNNRFMICCDICLDWFHGKCVNITKGQGKVMEEAGQDWKCPPCLAGLENTGDNTVQENDQTEVVDEATEELEELVDNDDHDDTFEDEFVSPPDISISSVKKPPPGPAQPQSRTRARRKSSSGGQSEVEKVKEKVVTCHMCKEKPRESSIYCSEACIKAHASQALSLLTQDGKMTKANNPVVVLEPKTNTLLNGPNAPTEGSLQTWLQSHTSFHVVMPSKPSSSRFYGGSHPKGRTGPKLIAPHREAPDKKTPGPAHRISFMEALQRKPVKSKEEMVAETKATLRRAISSHDSGRPAKKERRSSESVDRKQTPVRRRQEKVRVEHTEVKEVKPQDNKSLRSMVVKGVRDSLLEKLEKCSDLKFEASKILKIAEEVEIAMFGTFGEVGAKYKNKYRSLTYNIKDPKNDGLFRRILLRDLSPIEVVGMSADEYASKELQQWRRQEAKKDIEAIKLHELDMLALGNTYVMKSHKGEQVIEKSDVAAEVTPSSSGPILPEDVPDVKDTRGDGPHEATWDHPNHGSLTTEPLCDVCNGKMSLEEFVSAKVSREGGSGKKRSEEGRRHKDRDRERHSSSRSHSSRDKGHSSSSKSSKDKSHSSSSRDKSRSSKSHSSSSRSKGHSSSSKEKSHSSSSKDRSSSSKDKSSSSKDKSSSSKDRGHSSSSRRHSGSSKDKPHSSSSKGLDASFAAAALVEAEKADLQARINKATAAIEAAKMSGSDLIGHLEDAGSSTQEVVDIPEAGPGSPELDLDLPDMDMDTGESGRRYSSGADGEVTSTVTIATPEQWEGESTSQEPCVWEGQVMMQDVAKFSVSAYQVSGTSDYLRVDLKSSLTLVGRIPPAVCWDYIDKISKNPTKEILVLRLGPSNNDEKAAYEAFFQYLSSRDRFGVVGNANKLVKDCYIMPLSSTSPVPGALLPLSGQGLPLTRPDLLLTIIVRTKRVRPGDSLPSLPILPTPTKPSLPTPSMSIVEPLVPSLPAEPGSSPYSPPGSSPEYPPPHHKDSTAPFQPKTSTDGGFTEKLAKLQAEVAAKREELKKREAVKDQHPGPSFHSSIPPPNLPVFSTDVAQPRVLGMGPMGNMMGQGMAMPMHGPGGMLGLGSPPPAQSSLSRLSDADLLAKAQAMEQRPLPPPGPGMPGNLLGQGVGNLELQREEERGGWGRGNGGRGFRGRGREWDRKSDGWDNRREFGDRDRDREWRDRRDGREEGRRDRDRRDRDWGADEWEGRGGRRDFDRGSERRRDRERSRERDRGGRGGGWRREGRGHPGPGSNPWSDEEVRIEGEQSGNLGGNLNDFHRNVAAELANFDKQYLPPGGQH